MEISSLRTSRSNARKNRHTHVFTQTHSSNRIATYPQVDFLVIVNPNSGPGNAPLPGPDYVREVPRLNAYPNVRTIGYVKVDWCRRPLAESCHDVQLYADWKQKHEHEFPGLYVEGIFVDETPNHYSDDRLAYLDALGQFIKDADGLQGDRMVRTTPDIPLLATRFHFLPP